MRYIFIYTYFRFFFEMLCHSLNKQSNLLMDRLQNSCCNNSIRRYNQQRKHNLSLSHHSLISKDSQFDTILQAQKEFNKNEKIQRQESFIQKIKSNKISGRELVMQMQIKHQNMFNFLNQIKKSSNKFTSGFNPQEMIKKNELSIKNISGRKNSEKIIEQNDQSYKLLEELTTLKKKYHELQIKHQRLVQFVSNIKQEPIQIKQDETFISNPFQDQDQNATLQVIKIPMHFQRKERS